MSPIMIIGNHTDAGKTIASAIVCEALQADYWKPVQAGNLSQSDTISAQQLISNTRTVFHPESFKLQQPLSPHIAAALDGVEINLSQIQLPKTDNLLIIESAGGLLSPINDTQTNLDLLKQFLCPVILVSRNYLGSINHTLLTAEVLKQNKIQVLGILFNDTPTPSSESYILNHTGFPLIGHIPSIDMVDKKSIHQIAQTFIPKLTSLLP